MSQSQEKKGKRLLVHHLEPVMCTSVITGALKAVCCFFKGRDVHFSSEKSLHHSITHQFSITSLVKDKHQICKT